MVGAWPEPVERVSSFLREAGAEARIHEFPDGTPTAQDAADAVGCELGQIVKSLVFVCDERPVVALVPGDRRGDPAKVARAVERELGARREGAGGGGRDRVRARRRRSVPAAEDRHRPDGARALPSRDRLGGRRLAQATWSGISPAELGRLARARPMDVISDQT